MDYNHFDYIMNQSWAYDYSHIMSNSYYSLTYQIKYRNSNNIAIEIYVSNADIIEYRFDYNYNGNQKIEFRRDIGTYKELIEKGSEILDIMTFKTPGYIKDGIIDINMEPYL